MTKLLLLTFLILLCAPIRAASEDSVQIGVIGPFSGEMAAYGAKIREGIERAARPGIKFVFEDDACSSKEGLSAYRKLSDRGINFFLGPCCGSPMKTVAPLFAKAEQVVLATCPLAESLPEIAGENLFIPQPSVELEDMFLASQIFGRGGTKVVLVFRDTEFGRFHESAFKRNFQGTTTSLPFPNFEASSARDMAIKVKSLDIDAIYVPEVSPLLLGFLKELRKIGVTKDVYSIYPAQTPEVLTANGPHADGLIYSFPKMLEDEEPFVYFPKLAADLLGKTIVECVGSRACVKKALDIDQRFNEAGALKTDFELRTIKSGKFVKFASVTDNKRLDGSATRER